MPRRPARATRFLAILLSAVLLPLSDAPAQVALEAGSGVLPAPTSTRNSHERPVLFDSKIPAGAALAIPVAGANGFDAALAGLPPGTAAAIRSAATSAGFVGKPAKTVMLRGIPGFPAVLLVGVVPAEAPLETTLADYGGLAAQAFRDEKAPLAFLTTGLPRGSAPYVAFGATLGQYRYDRLKSNVPAPPTDPVTVVTADADAGPAFAADLKHLADSIRFARDLVTGPSNIKYPQSVAAAVQLEMRGMPNVRVTVLDEPAMQALKMGSLLGVGQGSRRPSRIVALEYRGAGDAAPLALVGKGITFDSGGISIKPATGMWEMKGDMSGAAAVLGAAMAAARRGDRVNVVAVAALAENMPGGNAQRPGDVVRTMNGQTVEVINTDAEGRLVLADANQWTIATFKPVALVNIATLTGAIANALGDEYAGLFARDEDVAARLMAGGKRTGEELWRMPLHPSYSDDMSSEIADIKNSNEGGRAGAGTAAHFIGFLTPEPTPWAHVDMAAVDRADTALPTVPKGPRGYGVRLLDQLIRSYQLR
jgi:leucyl aminopeptidase